MYIYAYFEILINFLFRLIQNWFGEDEDIFTDNNTSCDGTMHHHHHYHHCVALLPRISQTLSVATRLYYPSLPAGLVDLILCPYRAVVDKFLLVVLHFLFVWKDPKRNVAYEFVLVSPTVSPRLISLISMVLVVGGLWPYGCCFVGCCFQDLLNIARIILLPFPFWCFSVHLASMWCIHTVELTRLLLGKNYVLFYRKNFSSLWSIWYR